MNIKTTKYIIYILPLLIFFNSCKITQNITDNRKVLLYEVKNTKLADLMDNYISDMKDITQDSVFYLWMRNIDKKIGISFKTMEMSFDLSQEICKECRLIYRNGYIFYFVFYGEKELVENWFEIKEFPSFVLNKRKDCNYISIGEDDTICEHEYFYVYYNDIFYSIKKNKYCK